MKLGAVSSDRVFALAFMAELLLVGQVVAGSVAAFVLGILLALAVGCLAGILLASEAHS